MLLDRVLEPAGSSGTLPSVDPLTRQRNDMADEGGRGGSLTVQQGDCHATGILQTIADVGGDAMRSMAMDPVSATRQTLVAVRRHPYVAALLLLAFGAVIAGLARI